MNIEDGQRQHFQKGDLRNLGEALVMGIYYSEVRMKGEEGEQMRIPSVVVGREQGKGGNTMAAGNGVKENSFEVTNHTTSLLFETHTRKKNSDIVETITK